jgi:protein O-mannosyl-transferase
MAHRPVQVTSKKKKIAVTPWHARHEYLTFSIASGLWVLVLYHSTLHAPFVYDDVKQIVSNPWLGSIHGVLHLLSTPVKFTNDFLHPGQATYRPLFWASIALDYFAWGLAQPAGFHLTNLILHWANGLLGFFLLRRLRVNSFIAATAALLWLALPINSEVVVWVSGRAYLLLFTFLLLALLSLHSYLQSRRPIMCFGFCIFSFLALLSHEAGILILPLGILVAYVIDHKSYRSILLLSGMATGVCAVYLCLRRLVDVPSSHAQLALWPVGVAFFKYLVWMFLPLHMSVERSTDMPADQFSLFACAGLTGLVGIAVLTFFLNRSRPDIAAGIAWAMVGLLPFCGIVLLYQGVAERYEYLASAGICFSIAAFAGRFPRGHGKEIAWGLLSLWVLWGVWRLQERVLDWTDAARLYASSLRATPNSATLLYNLGAVSEQQGRFAAAKTAYEKALTLRPRYEPAVAGLGNVYLRLSDPRHAQAAYHTALALDPNDAGTITNLAVAYQQTNDAVDAEQQYRRAIAVAPNLDDAYSNLGALLFQQRRIPEAIAILTKATTVNPQDATGY